MAIRVGINGFGRIGRQVLRAAKSRRSQDLDFVAVNDLTDTKTLAHLFKYDSVHRTYRRRRRARATTRSRSTATRSRSSPRRIRRKLPWKDLGVDIVLESTGRFTERRRRAASTSTAARRRSSSRRRPRARTSPSCWA